MTPLFILKIEVRMLFETQVNHITIQNIPMGSHLFRNKILKMVSKALYFLVSNIFLILSFFFFFLSSLVSYGHYNMPGKLSQLSYLLLSSILNIFSQDIWRSGSFLLCLWIPAQTFPSKWGHLDLNKHLYSLGNIVN